MKTDGKVGVLMGGLSSEREQSLRSGEAALDALRAAGRDAVAIYVDAELDVALRAEKIDVAFLALAGHYGEDGCVQGMLELMGIPYTSSGVLGSASCMDKLRAKELLHHHNLPTPAHYVYVRGAGAPEEQHGNFGFPVMVKPRAEGSSFGVTLVRDVDELDAAIETGLRYDDHLLVERFIEGQEIQILLLDGRVVGCAELLHSERDLGAGRGRTRYFMPPRLADERLRGLLRMAQSASRVFELSGLVQIGVIAASKGNEYLLEVDTQPSFAKDGIVARVCAAAKTPLAELLCELLDKATLNARRRPAFKDGRRERRLLSTHNGGPDRRAQLAQSH
jgi:D-alanine-D-alanine ligase